MTRKQWIKSLVIGVSTATLALATFVWTNNAQASPHSARGCNTCHLPHGATGDGSANPNLSVPLWNPLHSATLLLTTDTYSGTTTGTKDPGPTGASVLCLSCHDGSYDRVTDAHSFGNGGGMGNLTNSHPISVVWSQSLIASGALKDPATHPELRFSIDGNGKLQCTGCHTGHSGEQDKRLRWVYDDDNLGPTSLTFCNTCHNK